MCQCPLTRGGADEEPSSIASSLSGDSWRSRHCDEEPSSIACLYSKVGQRGVQAGRPVYAVCVCLLGYAGGAGTLVGPAARLMLQEHLRHQDGYQGGDRGGRGGGKR